MPRPMLRTPQNQTQSQTVNNNILSATRNQEHEQQQQQMDKMKLDQLLRKKRSKEYMEALHKLDAGGHVHNQNKVCLLYTSPSPRDTERSRMPSSA